MPQKLLLKEFLAQHTDKVSKVKHTDKVRKVKHTDKVRKVIAHTAYGNGLFALIFFKIKRLFLRLRDYFLD